MKPVHLFLFAVQAAATAVAMSPPGILNCQGVINTNGLGFLRGERNQRPADYKL